jgi:low affinity Fe/Cu permease
MSSQKKQDIFTRFTTKTSEILGRPWIFTTALVLLIIWAATGPLLGFSDTWQLVINTSTTIITFLMVFIIQNTQNRNDLAVNIKLDALLDTEGIDSKKLFEAEDMSDKTLEKEKKQEQRKANKRKKR